MSIGHLVILLFVKTAEAQNLGGAVGRLRFQFPCIVRELFLPLVFFIIYYMPFLFPETSFVPIHDVFDGHIAEDRAVRDFYLDGVQSAAHILGGATPVWAMSRFMQPLSVIANLFLPILPAYLLIDFVVRLATYMSFRLLAIRLGVSPVWGVAVPLVISAAVTFSTYGFGSAGFALLLAVGLHRRQSGSIGFGATLVVFLVGWSTSFSVHSVFVVSGFLAASVLLQLGIRVRRLVKLSSVYFLASLLGGLNLIFAQFFSGISWHREEFSCGNCTLEQAFYEALTSSGIFFPFFHAYMYHISIPLTLLVAFSAIIAIFGSNKVTDRRRVWVSLLMGFGVPFVAPFIAFVQNLDFFQFLPSFQFSRIAVWGHLFFGLAILLAFKGVGEIHLKKIGIIAITLQLAFVGAFTPHIRAVYFNLSEGSAVSIVPPGLNFYTFLAESDYIKIGRIVGKGQVMSLGVEPSSSILNGINSVNGYLTMYPLSYKRNWLEVIEKVIENTANENYFKEWGSRVYSFAGPENYLSLNLCATGGRHIEYALSNFELSDEVYTLVWKSSSRDLLLYEVHPKCE